MATERAITGRGVAARYRHGRFDLTCGSVYCPPHARRNQHRRKTEKNSQVTRNNAKDSSFNKAAAAAASSTGADSSTSSLSSPPLLARPSETKRREYVVGFAVSSASPALAALVTNPIEVVKVVAF